MGVWVPIALWAISTAISIAMRPKKPTQLPNEPHSWDPKTVQKEGIPYELCFGTVPVQGNAFSPWTDVTNTTDNNTNLLLYLQLAFSLGVTAYVKRSRHQLNVRLAFGEGPVQGLQSAYSRLQGKPLADWSDVTATERLGTDVQTATGLGDRVEFARDDLVVSGTPVIVPMPDKDMDDAAIIVGCLDGLVTYGEATGEPLPRPIAGTIEIRKNGGAWQTLTAGSLLGKTINPVRWIYLASGTYTGGAAFAIDPDDVIDWRVSTTTAAPGSRDQGQLKILGVQAIYGSAYTHPGLAYLELQAVAAEGLNGSMEFEGVLDGLICENLAGTGFAFSKNPAVVMKYLWTMPVIHGDGGGTAFSVDYYRNYLPADLNTAEFQAAETWFNATVPDGDGGTEARFQFNGRFSESVEAWENPIKVASVCHAVTWFDGRQVRIYVDKATTASHIFCDANMIKDSYGEESVDKRNQPTAIEATIFNEDAGWVAQTVRVVDKLAPVQTTPVQVDGFGCTRVSQLARFARRIFDKNRNLDLLNSWKTGPCGMDAEKGQLCYIQSCANGRAVGGRVSAAPAANKVTLDQSVTITPGTSYQLIVQTLDDDGKHVTAYDVDSLEGTTIVVLTGVLTYTPVKGDLYIFGANIDQYRITSTKGDEYGNCEFTAEQYKASYYARDDDNPYYDTAIYVAASKPQRKSFEPVTRETLLTNYDDAKLIDSDASQRPVSSGIAFVGDNTDTVTWSVTGQNSLGYIRYENETFPIQADAVGTTSKYIYFDPNLADPTELQATDSLYDLQGEERFIGCINVAGVAYTQNWVRVGQNGQLTSIDEVPPGGLYRKELEETFEDSFDDFAQRWGLDNPGVEASIVSGGEHGGQCLQIGDNTGNDQTAIFFLKSIPFNALSLFRISARIKQTAGTGTFSLGVCGRNAADDGWVGPSGGTTYASSFYPCAASAKSATGSWVKYEGYFQGTAATGDSDEHADPSDPALLHDNVKYVRPFVDLNKSGAAGTYQIDDVVLEKVPEVGDGGTGASTAAGARGNLGVKNIALLADAPTAKTSDYPIVVGDNGKHFTNTGASGTVVFTLPAATAGLVFAFTRVASQALKVVPASGEQYRGYGADDYPELTSNGGTLWIRCITAGVWDVMSLYGTVTWWT